MKRKPIQILYAPESRNVNAMIIALCDDGSVWHRVIKAGASGRWVRVDSEEINTPSPHRDSIEGVDGPHGVY